MHSDIATYATKMADNRPLLDTTPDNLDLFAKSAGQPVTNGNAQVYSTRSYTLNINRALRHKIDSCDRVHVEYEVTGGGITGVMDTGTFELFRLACSVFYKNLPTTEGRSVIDYSEDYNRRAVVQQTYKVERAHEGGILGYTLNLYATKNKLLLNGKDIDRFIDRHLPAIHNIMFKPIRDGQFRNVDEYNKILSFQISKVLEQRQLNKQTTSASPTVPKDNVVLVPYNRTQSPVIEVPSSSDPAGASSAGGENIDCPRCKKKCRSRSAFCEMGAHWIHYFCDRLGEAVIHRLTHDKGFIYNCKHCINKDDTVLKRPVGASPKQPSAANQLTVPTVPTYHAGGCKTQAEAILDDEGDCVCAVCSVVITGVQNRCSKCLSICHDSCLDGVSGGAEASMCLSCCATVAQIRQQTASNPSDDQSSQDPLSQNGATISCDGFEAQSPSLPVSSCDVTEANHVVRPMSQTEAQDDDIGIPVKTNTNPTSNRDKSAKDKAVIKLREVRQLEAKLKKWEEDLKLREAKVTNSNVDSRRMEEYVSKTEARNVELEATVRTLQRKICLLENEVSNLTGKRSAPDSSCNPSTGYTNPLLPSNDSSSQHSTGGHSSAYMKETNDLVSGIHQQVTRFVLNKVSQQINKLELMDQEQNIPFMPDPRWPTSSRAPEKTSPQTLHVPLSQPHNHISTYTGMDRPWSAGAPINPTAQFPTSSGGGPVMQTHWEHGPQATPSMPMAEPSQFVDNRQDCIIEGRSNRPPRKQDTSTAQIDASHVSGQPVFYSNQQRNMSPSPSPSFLGRGQPARFRR